MAEAKPAHSRLRTVRGSALDALLALALVGVLWQVASSAVAGALAGPVEAFARLGEILTDARYHDDIVTTGLAFLWALGITWGGGLLATAILACSRFAGAVVEPLLTSFYSLPKITLYPIILLLFGLGQPAKIAFGVIHGIVPVILIGMAAIRNVKPVYLKLAATLKLSARDRTVWVLVPAILPELLSGLRIGFSLTLLGTLIGEMFAAKHGLGFMMMRAIDTNDGGTVMAVAILISVVALAANGLLGRLARSLE